MKKFFYIIMAAFLIAACGHQKSTVEAEEELQDSIECDSFTVVYREPVNGYKVSAKVRMAHDEINYADISFSKNGKTFSLHTTSYGDTVFNKGGWGMDDGEDAEIMKKYRNQTVEADYHEHREEEGIMSSWCPFFFRDLDFDGVEELVIVHYTMAVRNHDRYDVYRIVEGEPFLIDYLPYYNEVIGDYGMTDYPEFDFKNKTISCPYPEGELKYDGRITYGISKTRKDTVEVNGKKYYFNHMEKIDEEVYE
jgi:hypothetical protein